MPVWVNNLTWFLLGVWAGVFGLAVALCMWIKKGEKEDEQ